MPKHKQKKGQRTFYSRYFNEAYMGAQNPFDIILNDDDSNDERIKRLKKHLPEALLLCNETQQLYITEHYFNGKTMTDIATEYGICVSTVSRSIKSGIKRMYTGLIFLM